MKLTGQPNRAVAFALAAGGFFLGDAVAQRQQFGAAGARHKGGDQRGLNQAAHLKHLARLLLGGAGHGGAPVGRDGYHLLAGQAREHRADAGARHTKGAGQAVFAELGARVQLLVANGLHHALVNAFFSPCAGAGCGRCAHGAARWRFSSSRARPTVRPITTKDTTMVTVPRA